MKTVLDFQKAKVAGQKISMITCYDHWTAKIVNDSKVDCILVGDSVAMVAHGHSTTLPATVDLISSHVEAVRKGAPNKFIVADMPFLAHRGSVDSTMAAVAQLMRAGAQAVKIEGVDGSDQTIHHIVESGVPVMGHLGLTPQSIHQFGGFKVQATQDEAAKKLIEQAKRIERAGCFALVLECVPSEVARQVTSQLTIPTIGIGAGADTSGQVLVMQDLLGMNPEFAPKFVRRFLNGHEVFKAAFDQFDQAVKGAQFPNEKESY